MKFCIILFLSSFALSVMATSSFANQFVEVNSETVTFSDLKTYQSDLKLLYGYKFNLNETYWISLSAGGYALYQNDETFGYFYRLGPLAQLKFNIFQNYLFFQYEHHLSQFRSTYDPNNESFHHEDRYGIIGAYYSQINEAWDLDTYTEFFYIPKVAKDSLLSVLRITFLWNTPVLNQIQLMPFAEAYMKQAPRDFGYDKEEVRLGLRYSPASFMSLKVFSSVLPVTEKSSAGIQGQLNIYYRGDIL